MGNADIDIDTIELPFEFNMERDTLTEPMLRFEKLEHDLTDPRSGGSAGLFDMQAKPYDITNNANAQLNDLLENIKASLNAPAPSALCSNTAFPGGLYTDQLFQSTPQNPIPPAFASETTGQANNDHALVPTSSEKTLFADIAQPGTPFHSIPSVPASDPLLQTSLNASFFNPSAPNPAALTFGHTATFGQPQHNWHGQKFSRQYMECRKPKILFDPVYNRTVAVAFACSSCHRAKKRCVGGGIGKSCKACLKKGLTCKPRTDKRSHHSRLYSPMLTPPERAAFRRQRMIAQRMKQRAHKSVVRMPRSLLKLIAPLPKVEPRSAHAPTARLELPSTLLGLPAKVQIPNTLSTQLPNSRVGYGPAQTFSQPATNCPSSFMSPKVQFIGSPTRVEE